MMKLLSIMTIWMALAYAQEEIDLVVESEYYPIIKPLVKMPWKDWPNHDLGGCTIQGRSAILLAKAIEKNHSLKSICLSHNQLKGESAQVILQSLFSHPTLRQVDLSCNDFCNQSRETLIRSLNKNTKITSLNLRMTNFTGDQIANLFEALSKSKMIKSINLDTNLCDKQAISKLSQGESANTTLEELSLAMTGMSSQALGELALGCSRLKNLRNLNLSWNNFGSFDMQYIAKIVHYCPRLQFINLAQSQISLQSIGIFWLTLMSYPPSKRLRTTPLNIFLKHPKFGATVRKIIKHEKRHIVFWY